MDIESLKLLDSLLGRELLKKYYNYRDEELENLMFKVVPSERALMRAVVTLIKLRHKARDKFKLASEMFFTTDGAEQSTGEKIARHIAARFGERKKIVDLTCSIGGNLIFLAQKNFLTAVDKNEVNLLCAQKNVDVYGVRNQVKFIQGDAFANVIRGTEAFFVDPERARAGNTKTRSIFNSSPNISSLIPKMMTVTTDLGIKISPAFDYSEITKLPGDPEIEIISEDNVCKVAMLWFGNFKTCQRRATCFVGAEVYSYVDKQNFKKASAISELPQEYIYEPNKAIIKAHLLDEIIEKYSLYKLDPNIAYLTGPKINPREKIFRTMKVIIHGEYSLKKLQSLLKENEEIKTARKLNIITRRFPVKIEELYKRLKIKEGGDLFLILTSLKKDRRYFILARQER